MWSPIELHSEHAARCGLRSSLQVAFASHAHVQIVAAGAVGNTLCDPAEAAKTVAMLEGCAAAYIGARHGSPVAPFCGFRFVGDDVAHLEYFIDYESQGGERGRNAALYSFVMMLFHDFPVTKTVVSPLAVAGDEFPEFEQQSIGELVHFLRR